MEQARTSQAAPISDIRVSDSTLADEIREFIRRAGSTLQFNHSRRAYYGIKSHPHFRSNVLARFGPPICGPLLPEFPASSKCSDWRTDGCGAGLVWRNCSWS